MFLTLFIIWTCCNIVQNKVCINQDPCNCEMYLMNEISSVIKIKSKLSIQAIGWIYLHKGPIPHYVLFVCLFVVFRPTREFYTRMETSPLPVKGCKFWSLLDTCGHWGVRVLQRATPTVTRGIRLEWLSLRTRNNDTYGTPWLL